MLPFLSPSVALDSSESESATFFPFLFLTCSIVAAPTTAIILPAVARASRTGAGRAAALVEALLRETS